MSEEAGRPRDAHGQPIAGRGSPAKVQVYAAAANAAFADKAAGALVAAGHEIVTGDFEQSGAGAVLVIWSGSAIGSRRLIDAARAPQSKGRLIAVALGRIEPPAGFRHPAPIDLAGWTGDVEDPRWRLVLAEVERIVDGPASGPAQAEAAAAFGRWFEAPYTDDNGPARAAAPLASAPFGPGVGPRRARPASPILLGGFGLLAAAIFAGFVAIAQRRQDPPPTLAVALAPAPATLGAPPGAAKSDAAPEMARGPATAVAPDIAAENATAVASEAAPSVDQMDGAAGSAATAQTEDASADGIAALIVAHSSEVAPSPERLDVPPATETARAAAGATIMRDCATCPELAVIPAGAFRMGADMDEASRRPEEGPAVDVQIARPFALARRETSVAEWRLCAAAKACPALPDPGWRGEDMPVVNVSHADALAYCRWLSETTGKTYRLPSEAEWEYAARAGADTPFSFGAALSARAASFDGSLPYGGAPGPQRSRPRAVGSFEPNAFGLYDMHGNVWEWTADCWSPSHRGAAADGAPRSGECRLRTLKGGAWNSGGWRLRASHRIGKPASAREYDNGFRVARDLP